MKKNISIIIPTFNEKDNIIELYKEIKNNLVISKISWDVIFVDDSNNNDTANIIRKLQNSENNVFLIKRIENRGLSSALIQGALSTNSEYVLFMDGDLQHPPDTILSLYNEINKNNYDLVSASRFLNDNKLLDQKRYKASSFVNFLLRKLFKITYSDVLTGFFIINRNFFINNYKKFSNVGFKLLLDIILSTKKTIKYSEISFEFKKRYSGESKLNSKVFIDFIILIIDKLIGKIIPGRYFIYSLIGSLGIIFQLITFYILSNFINFNYSLLTSIILTIYFNYVLNNEFTYSDLKKKGTKFYKGLIRYYFFCSFGAVFNFISAKIIFDNLSNIYIAVVIGAFVGSIWNYSMNTSYNWNIKK